MTDETGKRDKTENLQDMLAGSKPEDFALNDEDRDWDAMRPVGDELL